MELILLLKSDDLLSFKKDIVFVKEDSKEFLIKKAGAHSHLYPPQGFKRDAVISTFLSKEGICPPTVLRKKEFLQEYVAGSRMLRFRSDMVRAASLLARLHSVRVPSQLKRTLESKDVCTRALGSRLSSREKNLLTAIHPGFVEHLDQLYTTVCNTSYPSGDKCVCHNDIVAQNWLVTKQSMHIIDFEWASYDHYSVDLASFLSPMNGMWSGQKMTKKQSDSFLHAYSRARGIPYSEVCAAVTQATPIILFLYFVWIARILISHSKKKSLTRRESCELSYARACLLLIKV